jgi:hypothetical protein
VKVNSIRAIFDRQFWKIGFVLLLVALFIGTWNLAWGWAFDTASRQTATRAVILSYPELAWAFDELNACDKGVGQYSSYRHTDECERAVGALVQRRGQESDFSKAVLMQSAIVSAH